MVDILSNILVRGDALNPQDTDLIAQIGTLIVGEPLPKGWNIICGNIHWSEVTKISMRSDIE